MVKALGSRQNDWIILVVIGFIYLADQLTKLFVERNLCPFRSIPSSGPLQLVCTYNTGSAFGLFQQHTNILILASIVGLGVLFYVYWVHYIPSTLFRMSLGLQLGGAFGNLLDRVFYGRVTDFIKIGPWPVFNLADSAVVVGIIILVWLLAFPKRKSKRAGSTTELFIRSKIYGKFS